ncbi:hypothetical protein LZ554_006755 [Drepanopeziza brunnea f. sp. 'monogermtubi']|nr:hypothetical protein LZ554_006755 [Drepanopeziza brunnea f. sp. 'monogermtubi']
MLAIAELHSALNGGSACLSGLSAASSDTLLSQTRMTKSLPNNQMIALLAVASDISDHCESSRPQLFQGRLKGFWAVYSTSHDGPSFSMLRSLTCREYSTIQRLADGGAQQHRQKSRRGADAQDLMEADHGLLVEALPSLRIALHTRLGNLTSICSPAKAVVDLVLLTPVGLSLRTASILSVLDTSAL